MTTRVCLSGSDWLSEFTIGRSHGTAPELSAPLSAPPPTTAMATKENIQQITGGNRTVIAALQTAAQSQSLGAIYTHTQARCVAAYRALTGLAGKLESLPDVIYKYTYSD